MSKIEKVTAYRIGDKLFTTLDFAERYLVEDGKISLLDNPLYKDNKFNDTSYFEHYIYEGAEHENRKCVGRFTTLREALDHMPYYRNSMGKNGSGFIDFVEIKENEGSQGSVEIERTTIISVH